MVYNNTTSYGIMLTGKDVVSGDIIFGGKLK